VLRGISNILPRLKKINVVGSNKALAAYTNNELHREDE
jgi:hypothetical protein